MRDTNDEHNQFTVEHFVHHPVVADTYTAQAPKVTFQQVPRVRSPGEPINGIRDTLTIPAIDLCQFAGCAALNPNRVVHF